MMYLVVFSIHFQYSSENPENLYQDISRVKKVSDFQKINTILSTYLCVVNWTSGIIF